MKKLLTILLILVLALALSSAALAEDGDEITDGGYVVMGPCFLTDLPATDEDAVPIEPMPAPDAPVPTEEAIVPIGPTTAPDAPIPTEEAIVPIGPTTAPGEPSTPVLLPSIRVTETEAGEEYFKDLNADGYYKCTQRFIITNNTQISISSVHIPTYGDLESRGFDWPHDDFAFYIVNGDGVPVETEVTLGMGLYLFNILFEPGDTYAALYWNPKERPWEPTGSWEPVNSELNEELLDIYARAMEGREDETWYEPYLLYKTQVVDDGVNYEFYANATVDYPYWPEAWTPETFGPEVPFFFIFIHEDIDGGCEVVSIKEPIYEPGGEAPAQPETPAVTPTEEELVPIGPMPDTQPDILSLTFSEDGSYAKLSAAVQGLYARVALVLETNGESGLYITQAAISGDGVILIPEMHVPGLTVTGVNVALVTSPEDVTSPTAEPVLFAFR